MSSPWIKPALAGKLLLAGLLLSLLAGVAGSQLAPQLPAYRAVLYGLAGAAALMAVLVGVAVVMLTLRQFILRHGGTDTQWFWFSADPPGLVQQREQAARAGLKSPQA